MTFRAIQKIRSYVNVFQICQLYQHLWSLPSHQKSQRKKQHQKPTHNQQQQGHPHHRQHPHSPKKLHQWSQQRQSQAEPSELWLT